MLNVQNASIDYADDVVPAIKRGAVTMNGRRAVVWEFDPVKKRNVQVDIITGADANEDTKRGVTTVQGRSSYLAETVRVSEEEARVTLTVKELGGCKDC